MKLLDYSLNEDDQRYSSKDTSINVSKLPSVYKHIDKDFTPDTVVLDYGGGKFDNVVDKYEKQYGTLVLVYDKYNRSSDHNNKVLNFIKDMNGADVVVCSNVLNVIEESEIRINQVIQDCYNLLKDNGTAYFYIYEGNKSGIGRVSKQKDTDIDSSYQNNQKTEFYLDEISSIFNQVTRKGQMIIAKK
jgi:hypothetical protein